jgi:transcriptional regulator with XRE-family HTH domain
MPHRDDSPLGEFIRAQRELSELSMRRLAAMSGISAPYLSQIEHGLRAPSERVLRSIAEGLKLSADVLLEQAGAEEDEESESAVVAAIRDDPRLTPAQRRSLIEIYEALVASGTR